MKYPFSKLFGKKNRRMKKIQITIFALLCFVGMEQLNAQTTTTQKNSEGNVQTTSNEVSEPKAVITFKTSQKSNPLIQKINELTNGDEILTEKVIANIQQTNTVKIKRVVSDNDFKSLSTELKQEAIKESDVIIIINQLRK